MSLQVWLPLDGTLENKGLSDTSTISTTNLSFVNNGKIGKCLSGYTGYFNIPEMAGKKQMSVAYWIRVNTATTTNWLDPFRWYSTDGSSSYGSRNEFYTNSTRTGFWFKGGSIGDAGKTYTIGTWRHHAFTINYETGEAEFFIDGVSTGKSTTVDTTHYLTGTNFMIGESGLDTSHNDLRIYDHCLSQKEVKELSKGLIGHWPLNDMVGGENLVPNQGKYTSENPYILQTNRTDGYVWVSNSAFEVEPSTQYTFSVCCDGVISNSHSAGGHSPSEKPFTTWFYTSIDGTTKNWQSGQYDYARNFTYSYSTFRQDGNRYIWTYTTAANEKYISLRLNGYSDGSTTIQIKFWNFKVEKGSTATPWIPAPSDDLYSKMGLDEGIVYDTSGYGRNGTITGNLVANSDTPRYNVCDYFDGSVYISGNSTTTEGKTLSLWVKCVPSFLTNHAGFIDYRSMLGFGFYNTYIVTTTTQNTTHRQVYDKTLIPDNEWTHVVIVRDTTIPKTRLYINGVEQTPWQTTDAWANGVSDGLTIGARTNGSSKFVGSISDLRIYATALSQDDIKELYEVSASVDKNGNMWGYELSET